MLKRWPRGERSAGAGRRRAAPGVKLFTRSGNTSVPDDTWSPWSSAYSRSEGEQITSPKARYLQWKTELSGSGSASPVVTSVTVAYLQRNLRPEISGITVHPPGVVFQKPFSSGDAELAGFDGAPNDRRGNQPAQASPAQPRPAAARRRSAAARSRRACRRSSGRPTTTTRTSLQFDVLYRREGETAWKPLKRGVSDPIFVWDTTSVPNGTYVVKIVASDGPGNPPGTALTGERESRSFDIDNAPPVISRHRGTPRRRAHGRGVHRAGRSLAGAARRVPRSTRTAGARFTRKTASPTRAWNSSS